MPAHRVLVVDDDRAFRRFVREAMEPIGWTVEGAATGKEGLGKAVANGFDVVLLDLHLPDVDGLRVLAGMRTGVPSVRVVAVTGDRSETQAMRFISEGAVGFLPKDVASPARIREVVLAAAQRESEVPGLVGMQGVAILLGGSASLRDHVREALRPLGMMVSLGAVRPPSHGLGAPRVALVEDSSAEGVAEKISLLRALGIGAPAVAILPPGTTDDVIAQVLEAGAEEFLTRDAATTLRIRKTVELLLRAVERKRA